MYYCTAITLLDSCWTAEPEIMSFLCQNLPPARQIQVYCVSRGNVVGASNLKHRKGAGCRGLVSSTAQ